MLKAVCKQVFWQFVLLVTVVTGAASAGAFWMDEQIFSPPRRALYYYHQERLENPADYGVRIRSHGCLQGEVPCLLVEPDAMAGPGVRGQRVREQLQANGVKLKPYGKVQATVVILHGRNGRKEDLLPVAERFVAAGFRCLLPDLPGHGDNPLPAMSFGSNDFERQLPRRVLEDARQHWNLPEEPAALWGLSMGGAFAVSAAREHPEDWDALVVVSSFSALWEVLVPYIPERWQGLAEPLQWFTDGARWLWQRPTIEDMAPREWAKDVTTPTLVVHGERDYYVSPQQGYQLYNALASSEKQWLGVPGAGHNSVLSANMPLYAEMLTWLDTVLAR